MAPEKRRLHTSTGHVHLRRSIDRSVVVCTMARERLQVDSQTLWERLNAFYPYLGPTDEALCQRALSRER